ncbi:hypothetical protein NDA11_007692 [Ustilago hordei]|uniref:Reverse transcriptase domain-containing protein n=1 Tax=Ustilago hordei TaxID=120017 RepID=I2G2G0_USTHO|nr:uncharacterized protein UHO2_02828 [Ustilago hordei]KAJ1593352.1 hypothetical protein NDA11_007692 [Ustilago hordei]CCF53353.1 uncharacterized protein UHOR_02454 [Ustilago hordei]SYW78816.1 uncharacterized protein UHO2_02828 [Ustilago hordei]
MSLLHSVNPVTTPSPHPGKLQQLLSPCLPTAMPPSPQSRLIPVRSSSSPIWLSNFSLSQLVPVSNLGSLSDPVTPPLPDPLQVLLADLASAALTSLQTLQPPVWPNTTMAAPLHSADGLPAHHGSMQAVSGNWRQALHCYPDPFFVVQLLGAIEHGVHLGYSGPLRHCGCHHHIKNLPMDDRSKSHIWSEISAWVQEGWLLEVDPQQFNLVCSPVGTVPKPCSSKLHTIHHLSHPRPPCPKQLLSVNEGITPHFTMIRYASLAKILDFVQEHLGCHLWKSDLTDAFRHVITTLADARLLSFSFDGHFFMETGLTFRGHSSPWIFNLFAEALHWIVQLAMGHPVDHYLDDFFGAVPASTDPGQLLHVLALACLALGLQLALQKTFWDTTKLEILGIQIDSVQQSVSITSEWCICILEAIDNLLHQCSAHLLDWQRVASLLQFVSQVVPHGKAFLHQLYDAIKTAHRCPLSLWCVSRPAALELRWWRSTLQAWLGHSLLQPSPLFIRHIWTDVSKRGFGAHLGPMHAPEAAFSREVPHCHWSKDICFLEVLAVLEALCTFLPLWSGPHLVVLHVDNTNVKFSLCNGRSHDPLTQTLLREIFGICFRWHVTLQPVHIALEDNCLADLLSCQCFLAIQTCFPVVHWLLFHPTSAEPQQPLLPPPAVPPLPLCTYGRAMLLPAAAVAPVSLAAIEHLSITVSDPAPHHSQPLTCSSLSGSVTWPSPTPSTVSGTSSMLSVPGTLISASPSMGSAMAAWSMQFTASNAPMASGQQLPSCPSLSHSSGPSWGNSRPSPLVPGTARSSPQLLLSPSPASYSVGRSLGAGLHQPLCWLGWSCGRTTMPSFSSQRRRPIPSDSEPHLWSPALVGWSAHMPPSTSSAPLSAGWMPPSLGCMMGTSHSPVPLSSSTSARLSLDLDWTCLIMQGTLSVEGWPLGLCHRALMQTPLSFSGTGTQTAIIDILTDWHLRGTPWLQQPSTCPIRDPSSLPVPLGRTWSSKLNLGGAPPAPLP